MIAVFIALFDILLLPKKPKTPPSYIEKDVDRVRDIVALKSIFKNKKMRLFILALGLTYGTFNGFVANMGFYM